MSSSDEDLPSEVADLDIAVPDIFAGVQANTQELEADIDQVGTIAEEVDEIEPTDIEEVDQVANQVKSLRADLIEADNADEIQSVYDDLKQAIASPHIQQARTSYQEICGVLEIAVDDETDEEIVSAFEDAGGDDIEAKATALSEVASTVAEFGDSIQTRLADEIEGSEKRYFKLPVDELQPLVSDYATRKQTLEEIAETAEQVGSWAAPLESVPEQSTAYDDIEATIDGEQVIEYINQIGFESVTDKVPLVDVVTSHLNTFIESNGVTELSDALSSILQSPLDDEYVDVIADLLSHPNVNIDGREVELHEAYTNATSSEDHTDFDQLTDALNELAESFEDWAATIASRIQAAARIEGEISQSKYSPPEFENPSETVAFNTNVQKAAIIEHPTDALAVVAAFDEWLSELGSGGGEDGINVGTLKSLIQGEPVLAQEVSDESIEELGEMLGEGLRLTYQPPDDE